MLKLRTKKQREKIDYREMGANGERNGEVLATFFVEPISPSESQRLIEDFTRKEWVSPDKKQKKELHKEILWGDLTKKRIDLIIVDWEGVVLFNPETGEIEDENPECNFENKMIVYENNQEVIQYVMDEAIELFEMTFEDKKEKEKNLKSGPNGRPEGKTEQ